MNRFKWRRRRQGGIWVKSAYRLTGWFQPSDYNYRTQYKQCRGLSWLVEDYTQDGEA